MTREVRVGDLVSWEQVPFDSLAEMPDGSVYLRRAVNGWTVTNVKISAAHFEDEPANGGGWEWIGNEEDGNAKILATELAPSLKADDLRRLVWAGRKVETWDRVPDGALVRTAAGMWVVRRGKEFKIVRDSSLVGQCVGRDRISEPATSVGATDVAQAEHYTCDLRPWKAPFEVCEVRPDGWTRDAILQATNDREAKGTPVMTASSGKWDDVPVGGLARSAKGAWFLKLADGARLVARWPWTPRDCVRIEINDPPENRWVFDIERAIRQSDDGALPPYELHGMQAKWTVAELQAAVDARDKYPRTAERWDQAPDGCLVRTAAGLWAARRGDKVHAVRGPVAAGRAAKVAELPAPGLASQYRLTDAGLGRDQAWATPLELHGVRPEWTRDEMLKVSDARELRDAPAAKTHGWDAVQVGALVRTAKGMYVVRSARGFHIARGWSSAGKRIAANIGGHVDEPTAIDAERRAAGGDVGWHGPLDVIAIRDTWTAEALTTAANEREAPTSSAQVAEATPAAAAVDRAYPYEVAGWDAVPEGGLGRTRAGAWAIRRDKNMIEVRSAEYAGKVVQEPKVGIKGMRRLDDPRFTAAEWQGPVEVHGTRDSRGDGWYLTDLIATTNAAETRPVVTVSEVPPTTTSAIAMGASVGDEVAWVDVPDGAMVQRPRGNVYVRRGAVGWCLGNGQVVEPEPTHPNRWSWADRVRYEGPARIVALNVPLGQTVPQLQAILDGVRIPVERRVGDAMLGSEVPSGALVRRASDDALFVRLGHGGWEVGEGDVVSLSLPTNTEIMWPWNGRASKEPERFILLAEGVPEFAARDVLQARLDAARPRPGDSIEWTKVPLGAIVCDDNGWMYARSAHDELTDVAFERRASGTGLRGLDALELYGGLGSVRWNGGAVWLPQSGLERPAFATVIMLGAGPDTTGDAVRKAWAEVRTVNI